ncbi:MAG: HDIG domain-containing protein [Anaerolineae bacterium]|nr:HDIG domain-containing protein [Anaerolineae bacterium]
MLRMTGLVSEANWPVIRQVLRVVTYILLVAAFILGGAFIVAYDALVPSQSKVALQEGQVAPDDILASRSIMYESEVLSEAKRDAEVAAVRPVYDPPDPSVETDQSQLARQILDYIENVLFDDLSTPEQKQQDLQVINALSLDPNVVSALLEIEEINGWRAIDVQVMRLLERVLSTEVREDNLQSKKDSLPNLISASFGESEVQIITAIVSDLIRVNAYFNEELTRQAQLEAAQNVPVEIRTFESGQMVIRAGEIATAAHIEALDQLGLLQVTERQQERFAGGLLSMVLVSLLFGVYLRRFDPRVYSNPSLVVVLGALFLSFMATARVIDPDNLSQPYYFPASAFAFLVTTLVGPQLGILAAFALAAFIGFVSNGSFEFTVLIGLCSTLGVLSLGKTERLNSYFVAGSIVGLASACIAIIFALGPNNSFDLFTFVSKLFGSVVNGVFSASVALAGLYVISGLLNETTSLKLVELMQPNQALLQRLLREAPGTYQHSLQVANLAELGAERIDANMQLVRVAAMYHDIGKILNAHFFIENLADSGNPHDELNDPIQSVKIIVGHVIEGDRLARRYRLPQRIRDFIREHHGTTQVVYFYQQALKHAEQTGEAVNIADFSYPGPRPRSRETAVLMLADGCESSVRARRPQREEDIQETVDYIFDTRLRDGQLDESGLTLNDLHILRNTFVSALKGIFHPRIRYPGTPSQPTGALPAGDSQRLLPEENTLAEDESPSKEEPEAQVMPDIKTDEQTGAQQKGESPSTGEAEAVQSDDSETKSAEQLTGPPKTGEEDENSTS